MIGKVGKDVDDDDNEDSGCCRRRKRIRRIIPYTSSKVKERMGLFREVVVLSSFTTKHDERMATHQSLMESICPQASGFRCFRECQGNNT